MDISPFNAGSTSLGDKVYGFLRGQIISGKLPPDTKLPETELSARLNVSRIPVREALNMLASDGFVVKTPRHGAAVAPVTRQEIDGNWELRRLLEPYAAKAACGLIPRDELESVRNNIVDIMETNDFDGYMESDYALHSIIYQYVPNSQLQQFLNQLMLSSMRFRYYAEYGCPSSIGILQSVCQEHCALIDALLAGDAELAGRRMLTHIENGHTRTGKQFTHIGKQK